MATTATPSTIGFDADDTLWHNERFFQLTQARFETLLAPFAPPEHLRERLLAAEIRNLSRYGFGVKGFTLSLIETALEVSNQTVAAPIIAELVEAGKDMLDHPIDLLPAVEDTIAALYGRYRLILITKGDLLDQERKLAQSGLGTYFEAVEIVSDKTPRHYHEIFARHGDGAARGVMIGNSLKSDVLPMIAAGGFGVHVPHAATWALEHADPPSDTERFAQIGTLAELPTLLATRRGENQR
ncbi:HAD family hydrolase [Rhodobacteraceae bacterium]|nr:HAD family hydrolase [Paracoccaceae bacterium]